MTGLEVTALAVAAAAGYSLLRRGRQLSADEALSHLRSGAQIIDVRTPEEFRSGHLQKAINIPLDEIATTLPRRCGDRNQVLLLHCQSGMRSGMAARRLRGLGYANAYNLGSYDRAAQIAGG